jgi:serine/threonine-protein kinase RsbW
MNTPTAKTDGETFTLESKLSEIARVPPWIERLADRHGIPGRIQFAMDLCLEEVLSNIIRHGYAGDSNHTLVVRHQNDRDGRFILIVEDQSPPFNPLLVQDPAAPQSLEGISGGGHGIQLLKQFADAIEYEAMSNGNRMTMTFVDRDSARPAPRTTSP